MPSLKDLLEFLFFLLLLIFNLGKMPDGMWPPKGWPLPPELPSGGPWQQLPPISWPTGTGTGDDLSQAPPQVPLSPNSTSPQRAAGSGSIPQAAVSQPAPRGSLTVDSLTVGGGSPSLPAATGGLGRSAAGEWAGLPRWRTGSGSAGRNGGAVAGETAFETEFVPVDGRFFSPAVPAILGLSALGGLAFMLRRRLTLPAGVASRLKARR